VWMIAVVAVGGFLVCLLLCYVTVFYLLVNSRSNTVKVLTNLRYIPEVIIEKEIIIEKPKKLSKRQLRRKRMREVDRELRLQYQENSQHGFESDSDEEGEEANPLPKEMSAKVISWISSSFSSKSSKVHAAADIETGKVKKKRNSSRFSFGFSTKSESLDSDGAAEGEGSTRSKRFISIDRLQRKEARSMLVKPKAAMVEEEVEEEEEIEYDNVVSLLSLNEAKRKRVATIMENRKLRKEPGEHAAVDVIALNAGPPMEMIPAGYQLVPQTLGPELLNPAVLVYKRILYLWDGSVGNIVGWFPGTVVGISEQTGYNFRIKYDREETKSIFVDGIQPVFLSLSGENAFGRRWVAIQKISKDEPIVER